jgi:hypothetical protein
MACCAFAAFIIGQCFALFDGWRRRARRLLGLPVIETSLSMHAPDPMRQPPSLRWRAVLGLALVAELSFVFGWGTVAVARGAPGLLPTAVVAWCTPSKISVR